MGSNPENPMPDDRHLFLAFSTFTGERATFEAWYDDEHIPQVLSAPGMAGAQRFVVDETKPLPGVASVDYGHLALYELQGDPTPFREEVKRLLMSGEMVLPDFMVQPFKTLFLKAVSAPFHSENLDATTDWNDRHLFFAWSRHTGDDATFERWYDEVHIPQIMSAPGMLRAQRFEPSDVKPLPGVETPDLVHLALYEIAGDLLPFREEVKRLLISGEMVIPEFMVQPFATMFMRPVSPFVTAVAATGSECRLSELGPVSSVAASGCGLRGAGSLRGCPGLSGSATRSGSVT
jgi:hypothetical protein